MREFLLSVTLSNVQKDVSVDFIASEAATPPAWTAVKDNKAKITRIFNNTDKQTRRIYFSITDKYVDKDDGTQTRVDLSATKMKAEEDEKSRREAPGFMLPANTYHVHAYSNGVFVKTSEPVTTLGYPTTTFPKQYNDDPNNKPFGDHPQWSDYAFNMVWITGNYSLEMEVGKQDVAYIPLRYLSVLDQNSSVPISICPGIRNPSFHIQAAGRKGAFYESIFEFRLGQLEAPEGSPTLFVASPRLKVTPESNRNQVLDIMVRIVGDYSYRTTISCFDADGPSPIGGEDAFPRYILKYVND